MSPLGLAGRRVVLWPDNDSPGHKYASVVAALLSLKHDVEAYIVAVPSEWPKGWDLADELPEGVTDADVERMLRDARPLAPSEDGDEVDEWPEWKRGARDRG